MELSRKSQAFPSGASRVCVGLSCHFKSKDIQNFLTDFKENCSSIFLMKCAQHLSVDISILREAVGGEIHTGREILKSR